MEKEIIQLGGPHLKTCPCGCGTKFRGRRNQKYLNNDHRYVVNNNKQSQENDKFSQDFFQVRLNHRILSENHNPIDETKWIFIGQLTKDGFNPDAYSKQSKNEQDDEFKYILDLAYRLSDDKQFVQIIKMK